MAIVTPVEQVPGSRRLTPHDGHHECDSCPLSGTAVHTESSTRMDSPIRHAREPKPLAVDVCVGVFEAPPVVVYHNLQLAIGNF